MKNIIEDIVTTKDASAASKKIKALKKKIETHPELKEKIKKQFDTSLDKRGKLISSLQKEVDIKTQLKEVSEIVSLSYIAKKYFKKKKEWLYHRINGNIINGKPASFTEDQKKQLNAAFKDVSKKIGSVTVS
ncbi:MAG TPA: DUF5053 domain-containing protein [Agriterribacter sp.]|nr:DUF5053 domain-containing protein [Agriterribacter sp.]HRQ50508.1 DUF5053 domain-containing protein [Agriterribacter sp.]